jgi:hypothetical protein
MTPDGIDQLEEAATSAETHCIGTGAIGQWTRNRQRSVVDVEQEVGDNEMSNVEEGVGANIERALDRGGKNSSRNGRMG